MTNDSLQNCTLQCYNLLKHGPYKFILKTGREKTMFVNL